MEKKLTVFKCIKWKCSRSIPVFSFTGLSLMWHTETNTCIYTYTCRYLFLKMRMHAINLAVFTSKENWVTGVGETHMFSSVQLLSRVWLSVTPWTAAHQASLSITSSRSLPKLMSIESVMPSNHLILCHPLLLLPSIFPSIRVFSNESAPRIRWPKYWEFQLQHQSFQWTPSTDLL